MINGGADDGAAIQDAYTLLAQNGATSIASFPYDGNYLAWDLNAQDWVAAISNRTTPLQMVSGVGGNQPQNLQLIKQMLNNGHIFTFGTYIDSWVFTTVKENPASPSPYAGQYAASWMNGTDGGHLISIVGYNDTVWIDVNGNGEVDPGELGAFLVANSWGTDWGNAGFVWISYDAFLAKSAVPNGPHHGRVPAAAPVNSYLLSTVAKTTSYSPQLLAQFSINQVERDQIAVTVGISDISETQPTQTFTSGAITYQGGPYEFNGTNPGSAETGTFTIDLTDLVTAAGATGPLRFYLILSDDTSGHTTTLTSYSLIDNVHSAQIPCAGVPVSCDDGTIHPYIDYDFANGVVPQEPVVYPSAIYVNAGGGAMNYQNTAWLADQDYTLPSTTHAALRPWGNSIYKTERIGTFSYNFSVANGPNTVQLKFMENDLRGIGRRVFNIVINGTEVVSNLDLYKVAGFGAPHDLSFPVDVTNNTIEIEFIPVVNVATISGIAITTP